MTLYTAPINSQSYQVLPCRILLVEAEFRMAIKLKNDLTSLGYEIVGSVDTYESAIQQYEAQQPDLVLTSVRLNSNKSGVEVAKYIQNQEKFCPLIYLSSQVDCNSLDAAKATFPEAYLLKPIQKQSLFTTIEMVMHRYRNQHLAPTIKVNEGSRSHLVSLDDILFLQADHVYIQIHRKSCKRPLLHRTTLKELTEILPAEQFLQTHRSFIINRRYVEAWKNEYLVIEGQTIPISRSRRKEVHHSLLQKV